MPTKLNGGPQQPVLVKTVYERKQYWWAIVAGIAAILTLVFMILASILDPKKLLDLSLGYFLRVRVLLVVTGVLLCVAGWLNLRAARTWQQVRTTQLSGARSIGAKQLQSRGEFTVGTKVRVKANLTQQEKMLGPGWEPQMEHYLGRASTVESIDKHGRVCLADFPEAFFLKEWLDLLEE